MSVAMRNALISEWVYDEEISLSSIWFLKASRFFDCFASKEISYLRRRWRALNKSRDQLAEEQVSSQYFVASIADVTNQEHEMSDWHAREIKTRNVRLAWSKHNVWVTCSHDKSKMSIDMFETICSLAWSYIKHDVFWHARKIRARYAELACSEYDMSD